MANINQVYGGNSLKAADLQGREFTLTIATVVNKSFDDGAKLIITFREAQKAFVCNKTNAQHIGALYGPETDGWIGRQIVLFPTEVMFQGTLTPAIRVRGSYQQMAPRQPAQPLPMINGQPGFVGAGQAGPLPPAQPQYQPPPVQQPAQRPLDDDIPF